MYDYKECLIKSGLTSEEADVFLNLSYKIKPPQTSIDQFEEEIEEGCLFEGGIDYSQALVCIWSSLDEN